MACWACFCHLLGFDLLLDDEPLVVRVDSVEVVLPSDLTGLILPVSLMMVVSSLILRFLFLLCSLDIIIVIHIIMVISFGLFELRNSDTFVLCAEFGIRLSSVCIL